MNQSFPCWAYRAPKPRIDPATLGERVRTQRKECRLTQAALAKRAGISVRHLGDIECGRRLPSVAAMFAIGTALDVSLDSMLGLPWPPEPLPPEMTRLIEKLSKAQEKTLLVISDVLDSLERHAVI